MSAGAIIRPFVELDRTDKAREIYRLARLGLTCGEIGNRVGFPAATILKIAREEGISVLATRRTSKIRDQDAVGFGEDIWDRPPHSLRLMHYKRMVAGAKKLRSEPSGTKTPEIKQTAPEASAEVWRPQSVEYGAPINLLSHSAARNIITLVSLKSGVSPGEMVGPRRTREIVAARYHAINLIHSHCPHLSYPAIGRMFNRDHTSILFALGRTKKDRKVKSRSGFPTLLSDVPTFGACNVGNPSNSGQISA